MRFDRLAPPMRSTWQDQAWAHRHAFPRRVDQIVEWEMQRRGFLLVDRIQETVRVHPGRGPFVVALVSDPAGSWLDLGGGV